MEIVSKTTKALKVKQFGLPRYVWLAVFAIAAGGALYIHNRNKQDAEGVEGGADEGTPEVDSTAGSDGYLSNQDYAQNWIPDTGLTLNPTMGGRNGGYQVTYGAPPVEQTTTNIIIGASGRDGATSKPCTSARPSNSDSALPKGYHWACVAGYWTAVPNKAGSTHGKPCQSRQPKKSAGKGKTWVCVKGKWTPQKIVVGMIDDGSKKHKTEMPTDPNHHFAKSMAPIRRDNKRIDHAPTHKPHNQLRRG